MGGGSSKIGVGRLTTREILVISKGGLVELCNTPAFKTRIEGGAAFVDRALEKDEVFYGITTGYGDSCSVTVPPHLKEELALSIVRCHGCGMGALFSCEETRAILAARLCSLAQGYSGVRFELLESVVELLNVNIMPCMPQEGSVGASGDLTPLSYLAAVLGGERDVLYNSKTSPASAVFKEVGITPMKLKPREGLAVINGTSVMTALACLNYERAEYLVKLCTKITALVCVAMRGNRCHFDKKLFEVKAHPGQQQIAAWLREDLNREGGSSLVEDSGRVQDRYSLRCAPHIIGVVQDSLPWLKGIIENELNSANDNPIIDADGRRVLHGGNFYGGHIAMAMDTLKTGVANLADLLDRQMAQLVDCKFNNGLPANLSGAVDERRVINHGFKGVQIAVSSWTAEALKQTMPASVFSRSTECHNQDKVSMGTTAARDCARILELTEQTAAASLLMSVQAVCLRRRRNELEEASLPTPSLIDFFDKIIRDFEFVVEDRALECDLRRFTGYIRALHWPLYGDESFL
eukprot:Lankesteria_metandrocarpae@DN215_c0_g1_i1.p1